MLLFVLLQSDPIVQPLAAISPLLGVIAAIAIAVVYWLSSQLKKKEDQVDELHKYIRDNDRENLRTIQDLTTMIDQLSETTTRHSVEIKKDLDATAERILMHVSSVLDRIRNNDQ